MLTRIRDLHPGDLPALTPRCSRCGVWGLGGGWSEAAEASLGLCGMVTTVDRRPVGYLLASTASAVSGSRRRAGTCLGLGCFSRDAAVLVGVYVDPRWQEMGVGRELVRGLAARAAGRGLGGVEATGVWPSGASSVRSCGQPPRRWLRAVGFQLIHERAVDPRWRLDLASTVRWRPALSQAWQRISDAVRPVPTVKPAHREPPTRVPSA